MASNCDVRKEYPQNLNFSAKRAKITLIKSAELFAKKWFLICSDPVEVTGFEWKLMAQEKPEGFLGLFLRLHRPEHRKGRFEFDINA